MPVYEYECPACEKVMEVQQRMSDEPLSSCPDCGGPVKKLVSMSSFQLKGGGWYSDGYSTKKETGKKNNKADGKEKKTGKETKKKESKSTPPCQSGSSECGKCPAAAGA